MSSQPQRSASPAEPEKHFWTRQKRFSPEMEAAYQAEVEGIREKRIARTGVVAAILYSSFALSDRVMVPDAWQQAWAIRFLLVVPLMLIGTLCLYKIRNIGHRQLLLAAATLVSGISLPWIASLSHHPNAAHYQTGITLIVLFGNIVLALRFRHALATSVALTLVYSLSLNFMATMSSQVRFNNALFLIAAVVISLIANFRMDQDQRRAWLARSRELERNAELSRAVEMLAKISAEDPLTQLANRREFDRRMNLEWGRATRDEKPVALIMVDIDCFKNYNDHYGHPAGDSCLQQIAATLRDIPKRSSDLVARLGGEEFIVLLPNTTLEDAGQLAERMRAAVEALKIAHSHSPVSFYVTATFGVAATVPAPRALGADLLAQADAALYRAKTQGRNRVAVASDLPVMQ
jgi:diguanylate cyclase (GGDEF)-like protein